MRPDSAGCEQGAATDGRRQLDASALLPYTACFATYPPDITGNAYDVLESGDHDVYLCSPLIPSIGDLDGLDTTSQCFIYSLFHRSCLSDYSR